MERPSAAQLTAIANQLRIHSITSTTAAGSGHPTSSMSAAEIMAALFFRVMRYDRSNPHRPENDRFILSKGHAAPVLYAAWAEAGILSVEDLQQLRTLGSDLEGHPTPRLDFVDIATGSLGQGLSVGVGEAIACRMDGLSARTYVLMGDGEIAEGSVWEAASLAATEGLDNIVGIVDVNGLGQSLETALGHDLEAYRARWAAFGWNALVIDGHDMEQVLSAFDRAQATRGKPTVILARTEKGYGVSFLEGKSGWHGKALKKEEMERALAELEPKAQSARGVEIPLPEGPAPRRAQPQPAAPLAYEMGKQVATREAFGLALKRLAPAFPDLVVLDADTQNSTFTEYFGKEYPSRFVEGYIAEQNMVGMAAGLSARGKLAVASTFACFLTRAYDQIRMAGISESNIKLCGSHVGVSIGEDGASQMGLEDIAMMRAVYGSAVLYPCDAVSTERLTEEMLRHRGLSYLRTSRPKTAVLYGSDENFPIGGSKVLKQSGQDRATVVAAGVTVYEALKAHEQLSGEGIAIQVVDAYSIKPLDADGIAAAAARTGNQLISVEDHYPQGGLGDALAGELSSRGVRVHKLAVNGLPHSGPPEVLLDRYGISARHIVEAVKSLL